MNIYDNTQNYFKHCGYGVYPFGMQQWYLLSISFMHVIAMKLKMSSSLYVTIKLIVKNKMNYIYQQQIN